MTEVVPQGRILAIGTDAVVVKDRTARLRRFARGIATAAPEFKAWRLATEYDAAIEALEAAGDHPKAVVTRKQQEDVAKARRERAANATRTAALIYGPLLFGGWVWATVTAGLILAGALLLKKRGSAHGEVVQRIAAVFVVSAVAGVVMYAFGVRPTPVDTSALPLAAGLLIGLPGGVLWLTHGKSPGLAVTLGAVAAVASLAVQGAFQAAWSPWYLLPGALATLPLAAWGLVWAWKHSADDGTFADDYRSGESPMVPVEVQPDRPNVISAVLATRALPQDTMPALVEPGVAYLNDRTIWTATIDTKGPSAEALLPSKPRAELAARLGLSTRRCILTVDEDYGSRLHITGVVGKPWTAGPSPLLTMERVDLWQGIPWGPTIEGDVIKWQVFGRNGLLGGESGAGKSTALAGIWAGFALAAGTPEGEGPSRIWVADGGEVDTKPLADFGLATGWTTELPDAVRILTEVRDEVDRRQHLLGRTKNPDGSTKRKVDPAFFAEHGLSFDLLLMDEVATFTQRKGKEASDLADLIREIAQRCRKVGIHFVLSTQSPSVDAIDGDARDVLPVRWLGRARSVDLGNKVMGKGAAGRGVSVSTLPNDDDSIGVGWYSAPGREVQMRPYDWTDANLAAVCRRAVELRKGSRVLTAADDDRVLAVQVADLIRDRGVTVPAGRVMLARDVAATLEMDQSLLRLALSRVGVATQKVSRPDAMSAHNHSHYVLSDLPASRAI